MSEDTGEQFIFADTDLNPVDLFLLQHIGKDMEDEGEIQRLADGFLNRVGQERTGNRFDLDHSALTAYLFDSFYSKKLTQQQQIGIKGILDTASRKSELFKELKTRLTTVDSEVRTYYRLQVYPYDYYKPAKLENGLANIILKLKCHALEQEFKGRFEKENNPGLVIQYFTDDNPEEFGLWMSAKGEPFDKEKIK